MAAFVHSYGFRPCDYWSLTVEERSAILKYGAERAAKATDSK